MKHIKLILSVVLVFFLSFALVSCGPKPHDNDNDIDGVSRPDCPHSWPGCPR